MSRAKAINRLLVGITGASGAIYGVRILEEVARRFDEVYLMISDAARQVIRAELGLNVGYGPDAVKALLGREFSNIALLSKNEFFSPPASGSFRHAGMIIAPCSMGTAGRIAHSISDDLMTRAADVCLKEGRKLVLVIRETPWSLIHLRNLTQLAEAGATILPAAPGFYHQPKTIDDLVNHVVGRVLQQYNMEQNLAPEWSVEESPDAY